MDHGEWHAMTGRRARIVAGLLSALIAVWIAILVLTSTTVTFRATLDYPAATATCAPPIAGLFADRSAYWLATEGLEPSSRKDTVCSDLRTAQAGLAALLTLPTVALFWFAIRRRPTTPSEAAVIRAAKAWNATIDAGVGPATDADAPVEPGRHPERPTG